MYCIRIIQRLFPSIISESLFAPAYRFATSQCLFAGRYYTRNHEWVFIEGDTAVVGISDFAQAALGDIVYVELPEVGKELNVGDSIGALESVKVVSDIHSPISGTVTEKNTEVEITPSLINKSAFDKGWLFKMKIKDINKRTNLMEETVYEAFKKRE